MTRSRALVLVLGLVLAVAGCGSSAVNGGGGGGGGGNGGGGGTTTDGGANGKGGGTNPDGGSGGGTADGGQGGATDGGTTDGGPGGVTDGGTTDGGSGGVTDGGSGGVTDGGTTDGGSGGTDGGTTDGGTGGIAGHHIKTVFMIVMENKNWDDIKGKSSAPYINDTLLADGVHAENYHSAPNIHPSEPNYIWLEAGTNFGISNDYGPYSNEQNTTAHLVTLLNKAGITWRAYEEGIDGSTCPLSGISSTNYAPKHDPMLFFDDSTGSLNKHDPYCIAHQRPYTELASDLQNDTVAQYNFITPNLCDDMHNSLGCSSFDSVKNGDDWLKANVPPILASKAYKDGGLLIITWDESENTFSCPLANCPIGFIVLSPYAKAPGYSNNIKYDHSSTLKTIEEIFDVHPLLGHAADSGTKDLSDFFTQFP